MSCSLVITQRFHTSASLVVIIQQPKEEMGPQIKKMIFVGYKTGCKAYQLWNPQTRSIVVSANVCFDKQVFPH